MRVSGRDDLKSFMKQVKKGRFVTRFAQTTPPLLSKKSVSHRSPKLYDTHEEKYILTSATTTFVLGSGGNLLVHSQLLFITCIVIY